MNASGHVRPRKNKEGKVIGYQAVIELPPDTKTGKRNRKYHSFGKGVTKKQAEKALRKILEEYETDTYIERNNITLCEWMDNWFELFNKGLSPTTERGYKNQIDIYIKTQPIADMLIQSISAEDVQTWVNTISASSPKTGKPLSGKTVKNVYINFNAAMEKAVTLEKIRKNPCKNVQLPKCQKKRIEIYSNDDIKRLLQVSKETDIELIVMLALTLGLRRGEMAALKWSKVDFEKLTITIDSNNVYVDKSISEDGFVTKAPKSASGNRVISITEKLAAVLKKHRALYEKNMGKLGSIFHDEDYVICQENGKPYTPNALTRKFTRFITSKGLPHMRFHDLRHINATIMLQQGISPKVAQARLGHSNVSVTLDVYSHVTKSLQTDSAEKVESFIL